MCFMGDGNTLEKPGINPDVANREARNFRNFVIYLERNYCSSQTQSVSTITELKFSLVIILEDAELCPDLKFTCDDAVYVVFLRYKAVIDACSLQPDIDLLPFGDQTEIGERVYTCFIYYLIHTSDYLSLFG